MHERDIRREMIPELLRLAAEAELPLNPPDLVTRLGQAISLYRGEIGDEAFRSEADRFLRNVKPDTSDAPIFGYMPEELEKLRLRRDMNPFVTQALWRVATPVMLPRTLAERMLTMVSRVEQLQELVNITDVLYSAGIIFVREVVDYDHNTVTQFSHRPEGDLIVKAIAAGTYRLTFTCTHYMRLPTAPINQMFPVLDKPSAVTASIDIAGHVEWCDFICGEPLTGEIARQKLGDFARHHLGKPLE